MENLANYFNVKDGVIAAESFSAIYPAVNKFMWDTLQFNLSRDGNVKELMDIKTHITNPYRRCVGGYHRNINIHFLLAEAMWIAGGHKDVEFLTIFNKQMAAYSDDGKVFHAPYGHRLRHWGVASEDEFANKGVENTGFDQVTNAIRLLSENPNTRQVVMEIWNPLFDLGHQTKDIPCNDIVMLKIRDGKLITTIGNRSNDLHWGLPTNLFQFSFLTELMAAALGVELGTQTHNSQSLHIYDWNDIAPRMAEEYQPGRDMYVDYFANERHMDFKFSNDVAVNRFHEIEHCLNLVIDNLMRVSRGEERIEDEIKQIGEFSKWFCDVYVLLENYIVYKQKISESKTEEEKDNVRLQFIKRVELLEISRSGLKDLHWDVAMLAKNFYAARLQKAKSEDKLLGTL